MMLKFIKTTKIWRSDYGVQWDFQLCQFIRATLKCVGGLSSTLHIVLLICPVRQSKRRMYTTVCAKQATIAIGQG